MAVTYVKNFSFPSDFGFTKSGSSVVPGKARGGHIKATTPHRYAKGGTFSKEPRIVQGTSPDVKEGVPYSPGFRQKNSDQSDHIFKGDKGLRGGMQAPAFRKGGMMKKADGGNIKVAAGKVQDGKKTPWSKDDGTSPGSFKRTPPKESKTNSSAAFDNFDDEDRNTEPATKQTGNVERMSEFSDFKHGGKVHKRSKGGHMDAAEKKDMHRDRPRNMGENPQAGGHDNKKSSTPYDYANGGHFTKKKVGVSEGPGDRFVKGATGYKAKAAKDPNDSDSGDSPRKRFAMGGSTTPQRFADGGQVTTQDRYETGPKGQKDTSGTQKQVKGDGMTYTSGGRIKNLGHYAHGGKIRMGEKQGTKDQYERAAGTPKKSTGDKKGSVGERPSGKAVGKSTKEAQGTHKDHGSPPTGHEQTMASGGLSRGTSPKRNAAIHAKMKKPGGAGALASIAGLLGGQGMPHQGPAPGMGPAPPGLSPNMGAPPGGPMGGMAPQGGGMGAPAMAHGGKVSHVFHHHVSHKA
jgi:hypothetical protein